MIFARSLSGRRFIGVTLFLLFALMLCSCNIDPSTQIGSGSSVTPIPTQVPCTGPQQHAGDSIKTIVSDGIRRTFLLHLPQSYGKSIIPLVIGYHGYSWTMQLTERLTGLNSEADKAGFLLAIPQGADTPPSWNAGVGAYGPTGDVNDVQFTHDLLAYLKKNYCVDNHRIYLVGFSLGGGMVYRLACTLSDPITAIATVSGAYYPFGSCHPSHPLPVLEMHGLADTQAPYNGNSATHTASVQSYLQNWLTVDACNRTSQTFLQQGDITGLEWTHCKAGVRIMHYRVGSGGHSWSMTKSINTSDLVWQFFRDLRQ